MEENIAHHMGQWWAFNKHVIRGGNFFASVKSINFTKSNFLHSHRSIRIMLKFELVKLKRSSNNYLDRQRLYDKILFASDIIL
jgi:hypothetical protein